MARKNNLYFCFYFIVLIMIAGCGPIIGPLRGASITKENLLNTQEPTKVDRNKIRAVKKIVIPDLYSFGGTAADDKRITNVMLDELILDIKRSGRFKIVSPADFTLEVEKLNLMREVFYSTDEQEKIDAWAKVGRALNCDAVLALQQKNKKINMATAFLQYLFVGTVDEQVITSLDLVGCQKGDVLWHQEQASTFTSGDLGIKNTPDDELKNMVAPIIKTLSADFLNS